MTFERQSVEFLYVYCLLLLAQPNSVAGSRAILDIVSVPYRSVPFISIIFFLFFLFETFIFRLLKFIEWTQWNRHLFAASGQTEHSIRFGWKISKGFGSGWTRWRFIWSTLWFCRLRCVARRNWLQPLTLPDKHSDHVMCEREACAQDCQIFVFKFNSVLRPNSKLFVLLSVTWTA